MKRRFYLIVIVAIALTSLWTTPSHAAENLPAQVSQRVKQKIAQLTKVPVGQVEILTAEPRTWPNGCLGIQLPDLVCTQALVEGWFVTAKTGKQRLNYRTDQTGNTVYLDPSSRP